MFSKLGLASSSCSHAAQPLLVLLQRALRRLLLARCAAAERRLGGVLADDARERLVRVVRVFRVVRSVAAPRAFASVGARSGGVQALPLVLILLLLF